MTLEPARRRAFAIRRWIAAPLLVLALLLSGCATPRYGDEYAAVVERAEARWDAILANDLETAYTYLSPGYRSTTSLIDFGVEMRTRRLQWTSAEYLDHQCEPRRCTVRFKIGFRVYAPVPGMRVWDSFSTVKETWVETRGNWWYLPEK